MQKRGPPASRTGNTTKRTPPHASATTEAFFAPTGQKFIGKPKTIHIDFETKPIKGWAWRPWDTDLMETEENTSILSVAWHDEDEGVTHVKSLRHFTGHKRDATNDLKLCKFIWKILDSADIVVGQNINNFDIPLINGRFYMHDLGPTRPYLTIDTLKLFKKFRLDSNKLDSVSKQKDGGRKLKTHGKDTWLGCVRWDLKEWAIMEEYNKHDVDIEMKRYKELLPWIPQRSNRRKPIVAKSYVV